jgi:hypothetical protein
MERRLHLCRFEEAVDNRRIGPFAVAEVVVSVRRLPPLHGARHDDDVVSDLDLGAAIGQFRNHIRFAAILPRAAF